MGPLAAALVLASAGSPQEEIVGGRFRHWRAEIQGTVKGQGDTFTATDIDLKSHLGMDDADAAGEVQAFLRFPVVGRFTGGYWRAAFKGEATLEETIVFDDNIFLSGSRVESELRLDVYSLSYEFILPLPLDSGPVGVELGFLGGLRVITADGSVESTLGSAQDTGSGGLPVLGGHLTLRVMSWLRAEGEFVGLKFASDDRKVRYSEAYAEVVVQPWIGVFAGAGYKHVSLDLLDRTGRTEFEADVTLDGFYLTAGVRF